MLFLRIAAAATVNILPSTLEFGYNPEGGKCISSGNCLIMSFNFSVKAMKLKAFIPEASD